MEDDNITYTLDIGYKIFRKGNHKYIDFKKYITGLTERYHLAIQEEIITSLSDYQLKRLIKLYNDELQRRNEKKKETGDRRWKKHIF